MGINFADFEGRLCTVVPWEKKRIVRFFDYILRIKPQAAENHLKEYVPMYVGDLRQRFREEEIDYLRWISSHISLMQDMNNIIKATLKKNTLKTYGHSLPAVIFYNLAYNSFLGLSTEDVLKQHRMDKKSHFRYMEAKFQLLVKKMYSINQKNNYQFFKVSVEGTPSTSATVFTLKASCIAVYL